MEREIGGPAGSSARRGARRLRPGAGPVAGRSGLVLVLLAVSALGCAPPPLEQVILVVVDTLRADHLGLYGYSRPTSPHLDRRASQALVFDRAFSTSPWTMPAFGSILTGQLPTRHGAGNRLRESGWTHSGRLDGDLPNLARLLEQRGFATGAIVNNTWLKPKFGFTRGFQAYDYRTASTRRARRADRVVDLALGWIDEHGTRPFFLLVHLFDPHLGYEAPPPFRGRFSAGLPEPGFRVAEPADVRERIDQLSAAEKEYFRAAYDEEIAWVDDQLERLFAALEERELWSRALVVLTADHGEELFEHGGFEHGHALFQEVLRVPLLIWGPGIRAGRRADPVSLVDLAPTILEAAGVELPGELAGVSLRPHRRPGGRPASRPLVAESTLYGAERKALLRWPYKLETDEETGALRLYDLSTDPEESRDLADRETEIARRLEAELRGLLAAARPVEGGDEVPLDQATLEELRALGYVQ